MERPIFEKAHQALQALFNDPSAKQMIEDRAKAVANFSTAMDASREEGRLEGMQEGMQEGIEKGIEKASKRHRKISPRSRIKHAF